MDNSNLVPPHLREGLERWIRNGVEPGGFLRALLQNDLVGAVLRADPISREAIPSVVRWLTESAPEGSYGSLKNYQNWPAYLKALERQAEEASRR